MLWERDQGEENMDIKEDCFFSLSLVFLSTLDRYPHLSLNHPRIFFSSVCFLSLQLSVTDACIFLGIFLTASNRYMKTTS